MTRSKRQKRKTRQRTSAPKPRKRENKSSGPPSAVDHDDTKTSTINDDEKALAGVLTELQANLKVLAARRRELPEGGFDPDLAAATAAIAKAALTAIGERRQRAKARRRELDLFTDGELVDRLKALPDGRREAIIIGAQGEDLAGKPLFG